MTHSIGTNSRRSITIVLTLIFLIVVATAQDQTDKPASSAPQPTVNLNFLVLDNAKHAVSDVKQDDLLVFDDGVEQKISQFARDMRPLSFGLLLDATGSLRTQAGQVVEASSKFIRSTRPEDEGFVMRFVNQDKIAMLQDFTIHKAELLKSLDDYIPEGGQTAFVDAVYLAVQRMAQRKRDADSVKRRQVLVIISDGDDRDSYYSRDQLVKSLRENDVQIFAIGLVEELDEKERGVTFPRHPRKQAIELLDRLTTETGGRVYYPRSAKEIPKAVEDLVDDLKSQYVIGYSPIAKRKNRSYRKIKVLLAGANANQQREVIVRKGYTVSDK